ncbi:MAG: hypothetical protein QXU18_08180 [Thermoplasmatales archaeon]
MKRPVEHGNVFTSIILGTSSIVLAVATKKDFYSILFWIPIWMGLFLYDVPFKRVWKSREDAFWIILIFIFSAVSIYVNPLLIIPYVIFFSDYVLRLYFASRRLNYIGTILGMLAFVLLFVETINLSGFKEIYMLTALFVFMIGSEFTARAVLTRNRILLLYDFFPVLLTILNPVFLIFAISVIRIPVAIKAKGLRIVGVTETTLLLVATVIISVFYLI